MAEQLFPRKQMYPVLAPSQEAHDPDFTPTKDVFTDGTTHRVLLAFNRASGWSRTAVLALVTILTLLVASIWIVTADFLVVAVGVATIQLLFIAGDTAVLFTQTEKKIAFGPRKAQLLALATPRFFATFVLALVAPLIGWEWAFAAFVLVQMTATVALYWGAIVEPSKLELTTLDITSNRLATGTPPIRLLHISDIHLERWSRREDQLLAHVAQTQPDLIVITGDYVSTSNNADPETMAQVRNLLSQLSAPYGVYATLGTPPVDLRENVVPIFDDLGVKLMREDWEQIDLGKGRRLTLLGMDFTHYLPDDIARLGRILAAAPQDAPQLLITHSPEIMPQAVESGIDLYLCGHTHGGQVRLPFIGPLLTSSQLGRRYVMGHYHEERTHLYVTRGIGFEGLSAPRVRFMAPPETTLVTIHAE
ncbi:MAG: metallophosphoesterase [Chloroflexota bacterium]